MARLLRISILGSLPGGEQWSVNPVYVMGDFDESITPAEAAAMVTAVNNVSVPSTLRAIMSASTTFTGVRLEARQFDGTLETVAEGVRATPTAGTGASTHPYQTAWVTSLRSNAVGGSGRGRLYWPATGAVLDSDTLRPITGNVVNAVTGVRDYLQLISTALETVVGNATLSVWSRTQNAGHTVVSLQMGDVLDVQRRRRDTLTEAYSVLAYTP